MNMVILNICYIIIKKIIKGSTTGRELSDYVLIITKLEQKPVASTHSSYIQT